jgi:hypothetical protein
VIPYAHFCRNQSRKDASHLKADRIGPGLELFQQPFAGQHSFERDQDVAAEAFDPAILNSAKPVRVCTLCLEIAEQAWINPSRSHFVSVLQRIVRNQYGATDGLPGNAALLHCRDHFAPSSQRPRVGGVTMQQVTVRVPASTSNLGPGYDCLGVALRLYNSVTVVRGKAARSSQPRIVSDAAERFFKQTRRRAFSFSCSIVERVPRCRGLGSSATVRLGILLGLNHLSGNPLDRLTVFQLCAESEDILKTLHRPAFGGLTVVQSSGARRVCAAKREACPAVSVSTSRPAFILFY